MLIKHGKRGEMSEWECDECHKYFFVKRGRATEAIKNNQRKFCSEDCKKKNWDKTSWQRVVDHVNKFGNSNFTGGVGITTDGYLWILVKNRGYQHNQIKLHRYLMEIKLGRPLLSTEIVHHKNHDKLDNNIDNLEIVTRAEHNRIHFKK